MAKAPFKPVAVIDGINNDVQGFFDLLISKTFTHYANTRKNRWGFNIYNIEDFVFGLGTKDKLSINNKTIDGQRMQELFITTIFCKLLEERCKEKSEIIFINIPFEEKAYDSMVVTASRNKLRIYKNEKERTVFMPEVENGIYKDGFLARFQIKIYFDFENYSEFKKSGKVKPYPVNEELINLEKLNIGKENVLYYFRGPVLIDSDELIDMFKDFQGEHLYCIQHFEYDVPLYSQSGKSCIKAYEDKFNYIIHDVITDDRFVVYFELPNEMK